MADPKKAGEITDPNNMRPCGRCGGEHKPYQTCNIESRIVELTREKQALQDRCDKLERKQRCFDTVVELLVSNPQFVNHEKEKETKRLRRSYGLCD